MEDTHIPTILRDAQVGTIWEGTTNVLAHDLFRAIQTTKTCLPLFFETGKEVGEGYSALDLLLLFFRQTASPEFIPVGLGLGASKVAVQCSQNIESAISGKC